MPPVGINALIVLPHGWVICGYVAEDTGDYRLRIERAAVICNTGGHAWDEVADGVNREGVVYRYWGEVFIGPAYVISRRWKGDLPCGS